MPDKSLIKNKKQEYKVLKRGLRVRSTYNTQVIPDGCTLKDWVRKHSEFWRLYAAKVYREEKKEFSVDIEKLIPMEFNGCNYTIIIKYINYYDPYHHSIDWGEFGLHFTRDACTCQDEYFVADCIQCNIHKYDDIQKYHDNEIYYSDGKITREFLSNLPPRTIINFNIDGVMTLDEIPPNVWRCFKPIFSSNGKINKIEFLGLSKFIPL